MNECGIMLSQQRPLTLAFGSTAPRGIMTQQLKDLGYTQIKSETEAQHQG